MEIIILAVFLFGVFVGSRKFAKDEKEGSDIALEETYKRLGCNTK